MPGVFLSHSSKDKPFVLRLAADLVLEGAPVWLDSWVMDVGDSLYKAIYSGIEQSSFLIAIVTEHALKSGWVEKELMAALAMEDRVGRKFVLPVLAERVELPLQLAGRIYADFTAGYLDGLERLLAALRKLGAMEAVVPPDKRVVPLQFSDTIFLKRDVLQKALSFLPADHVPTASQLIIFPCPTYDNLHSALKRRLENVHSDPFYSAQFEESLEAYYKKMRKLEQSLVQGIAEILDSGRTAGISPVYLHDICRSFAMYLRSELYALMYGCQNPEAMVLDKRNPKWRANSQTEESIKDLHQIQSAGRIDVGFATPDKDGFVSGLYEAISAVIDEDGTDFKQLKIYEYLQILRVASNMSHSTLCGYVLPQWLYRKHVYGESIQLWDIGRLYYGRN